MRSGEQRRADAVGLVDALNGGKFISPSPSFGCFKFNFAPRFSKARNKKATKHT
jgi:hypothetical protein